MLSYGELGDIDLDEIDRSSLNVPVLYYHRTEIKLRMPDYKIYIHSSFARKDNKYLDCDFKVALICMQANIKWIIKNKKSLGFNEWAEEVAKAKCVQLKKDTLLVEKEFLAKMSQGDATSAYGKNIAFVSADDVNTAVMDTVKGKAAYMAVPYGLIKGNFGPISQSALTYFKIIVDCETGDILWTNNPGSFSMGKNLTRNIVKSEFEHMKVCKM